MSQATTVPLAELLRQMRKESLLPPAPRGREPLLDRSGVEALLPHRDPFLFVDQVTALDTDAGLIAARYDLGRARDVLAGHFPGQPVWPGVLQVEAIGQAATILYLRQAGLGAVPRVLATHILSARFMRPITPGDDIEILARVFDDGLFFTAVGQCLQRAAICSVAAVQLLSEADA
jgi:3-hydroxyacyl-[acyl-carrier-protein] dehydratase